MKFVCILFLFIFILKNSFANNLFETDEYELQFESSNINLKKQEKINKIKIKSFNKLLKKILIEDNFNEIKTNDINFVNKFILNFKIKNEKIINNNYFSNIKINFNRDLIFNYLKSNKINFIDYNPDKFLIIIMDEDYLNNYLFSKKNKYYQYLINSKLSDYKKSFIIPDLDYNDRYIFNEFHFKNNKFEQNKLLNKKYNTDYQILIHSIKINNFHNITISLFHERNKYLIKNLKIKKINYDDLFKLVLSMSLNKWKEINQINTAIISTLTCKVFINNLHELKYIRNLMMNNQSINSFILKSIKLNQNLYEISYFGSLDILKKSLFRQRIHFENDQGNCSIKLV